MSYQITAKFALAAFSLSCFSTLASAQSLDDVRDLHPNETPVSQLPKAQLHTLHRGVLATTENDSVQADVVVFYQPSYFKKYGAYEAHKRIQAWVDVANNSYQAHGLNYRLNVSDVVPVESIPDDMPFRDVKDSEGNTIQEGADGLFSLMTLNRGNPEYDVYQMKWKGDIAVYIREQRPEDTVLGLAGIGGKLQVFLTMVATLAPTLR